MLIKTVHQIVSKRIILFTETQTWRMVVKINSDKCSIFYSIGPILAVTDEHLGTKDSSRTGRTSWPLTMANYPAER